MSIERFRSHIVALDDLEEDDLVLCCDDRIVAVGLSLGAALHAETIWVIFLWSNEADEEQILAVADTLSNGEQFQVLRVDLELVREAYSEYRRAHPNDELLLIRDVAPALICMSQLKASAPFN